MKLKVLADTSCAYAFLNPDREPTLAAQLPSPGPDTHFYTGQYLRMEFFRRFILTGIHVYFRARLTGDIPEALHYFSQGFRSRETKIALKFAGDYVGELLREKCDNPIEQLGKLVYSLSRAYDKLFKRPVPPKTRCKRGEIQFDLTCHTVREALSDFAKRFEEKDVGCDLSQTLSGADFQQVIQSQAPKDCSKEAIKALNEIRGSAVKFQKRQRNGVGCKDCFLLGDVFIALEQPPSWTLYHTDHSFDALCSILKHNHVRCDSVLATAPTVQQAMQAGAAVSREEDDSEPLMDMDAPK